ncbi:6-pyruvoyl trahydropterin synthase family protein [Marinobacter sp. M1N3S26]|uniref:6-pyruvoyl trahydropterin synthase family protein n=1 Tax=Marinobacter sp. M1N3S26 TaxID=3382299 RepID=UPI00387A95FE
MYTLTVRDHVMIAHSFRGEVFGPAQQLHGATYTVDVGFERPALDQNDLVVDIGLASEALAHILAPINMQNLDEMERFKGRNTTTEFMARYIFDRMAEAIRNGVLGYGARELTGLVVTLSESHVAWASYRDTL